ncbi:MAG TPA: phage tail sheath C-terminal domain-containing protein [Methylomirabilota bacterium]|nr:phage tail sheath C-terminal domain-containing protein [Methylomirabilota bacterium]
MTIPFNQIPIDLRVPGTYIEFDNSRAVRGKLSVPGRILAIGQKLAAGTAAANTPVRVDTAALAVELFGRGSMLALMAAAIKAANRDTELWALPLADNGGGTAAAGTITVTGPATAAGTLNLYVGGKRVQVAVASGDTANTIAAAINAAINADLDLPVTSTVLAAEVTVTARHKGVAAGKVDLRHSYYQGEKLPAGVTLAIVQLTGGAGNPDLATALAALGDAWHNTWVMPYTDATSLSAVETDLANRWGPTKMIESHAFSAEVGTVGDLTTLGNSRNSPHLTIMDAGGSPTAPFIWAAVVAAVDAAETDPARPRQTLPLPGLLAAPEGARRTLEERNTLLYDGISTHAVDALGGVRIERLITTYQVNAQSLDDPSYLDVTTLRTLSHLRYSARARLATKYGRHKLANDGTRFAPGQAVVTPNVIRAEIIALFREWEIEGLVENFDQFRDDLVVQRNAEDPNRLDVLIPPDLINQLRVIAAQIQFRV